MNARILLVAVAVLLAVALGILFVPTGEGPGGISATGDADGGTGIAALDDAELATDPEREGDAIVRTDAKREVERRAVTDRTAAKEGGAEIPTGPKMKGRVVDELGRGVPSATVEMRVPLRDQGLIGLLVEDVLTRQETTTDGLGYFELIGLPGKTVEFDVSADGYAKLQAKEMDLPTDFTLPIEDLAIEAGVILYGTVVDLAGRAIEGAELFVSNPDEFVWRGPFGEEPPAAVTDAEGRFELAQVSTGKWEVEARAFERPARSVKGESPDPGRVPIALVIELPDGGSISGTVKGLAQQRYAEFSVEAEAQGEGGFWRGGAVGRPESAIDENGRFEIRGLDREKDYEVKLAPVDSGLLAFAGMTGTRSDTVTIKPLDVEIELVYEPGAALRFQVVDATNDEPVEIYEARFGQPGNVRQLTTPDGSVRVEHREGRAEFSDLYESDSAFWNDGGWRLEIDAPGFEPYTKEEIKIVDGVDIDLGAIELMPTGRLSIVVRDAEDGDPINSAIVRLTKLSERDGEEQASWRGLEMLSAPVKKAKTSADGRATLDGFGSLPAELTVSKSRYADFVQRVVMGEDDLELEVLLSTGAEVTCLTRDVNGNELGDVEIERRGPNDDEVVESRGASNSGKARFRGLMAGEHQFRIAARRDGEDNPWSKVTLGPGTRTELVVLGPPRGRILGRVTEAGRPLAGAEVSVRRADGNDEQRWERRGRRGGSMVVGRSADTDANGFYEVNDLDYGEYVVVVEHDRRAMPDSVEVTLDRAEVRTDVSLTICGVAGVVVDAAGDPVAGVRVVARPLNGPEEQQMPWMAFMDDGDAEDLGTFAVGPGPVTDAAGVFELRGLSDGVSVVLSVESPLVIGGTSEEFVLEPDEMRTGFRIEVERGASLEVKLLGEIDGFFELELSRPDGTYSSTSYAWQGNSGPFQRLEAGRYTLKVKRGGEENEDEPPVAEMEVELSVGEEREVSVEI